MIWQELADNGINTRGRYHGQIKTTCPQCSATRTNKRDKCLSVNLDDGVWACHHCGWKGGAKKPDYKQNSFQAKLYKKPDYKHDEALDPKVIKWFAGRGISHETLERNKIGYKTVTMPQHDFKEMTAISFPYLRNQEVVNVKYRDACKHFRMEKDAEIIPYGYDDISGEVLIWVEGEIDKLSIEEAGWQNCLSVPNGANSKLEFLEQMQIVLDAVKFHIIAVDNDPPGAILRDELVRRLSPDKCYIVKWQEGCKDANEVLLTHGVEGIKFALDKAQPPPIAGTYEINDFRDEVMEMHENGIEKGIHPGSDKLAQLYNIKSGQWTLVTGIPGHGKALALDTLIPTPTGFKTMGELQIGDKVFDENGLPCNVTKVTGIQLNRKCYKITFSDFTEIVCDAEHRWLTRDDKARRSEYQTKKRGRDKRDTLQPRGTDQTHKKTFPSVKTTEEIAQTLFAENGARANHAIPISKPITCEEKELLIAPYVLGVWLGDGTSSSGQITSSDVELIEDIRNHGYLVKKNTGKYHYYIHDLKWRLRKLYVLNNKHIPQEYLRGSEQQRLALLQGLMDTDGYITNYGRCEFTSINKRLAEGCYELVASLGWIPRIIEGNATLNGKICGRKYRVTFTPNANVFRLLRKAQFINTKPSKRLDWRYIVSCDEVESVPVKCIQVDSPSHLYLCTRSFIPTHNTHWLDWLCMNLAVSHGWKFSMCSPENQPLKRHAAGLTRLYTQKPFYKGYRNHASKEELTDALDFMQEHFKFILPDEDGDWSIDGVLDIAEQHVKRYGINGLIVDPYNELEYSRENGLNISEYVSRFLSKLRRFARKYDIHIWLVAHPTKLKKDLRTGEYPVPTPYDVSDSAHFRNKADNCITVYRDVTQERGTSTTQIHVQKIRFQECGQIGVCELFFDKPTGIYSDRALYLEGTE